MDPHGGPGGEVSQQALAATRSFVRTHASGADSWAEVLGSLARTARLDSAGLRASLVGINRILVDPAVADELLRLVAWDANWAVDDLAGARAWLRELADAIRMALSAS